MDDLEALVLMFTANIDQLNAVPTQIDAVFNRVVSSAATGSADMTASITSVAGSFDTINAAMAEMSSMTQAGAEEAGASLNSLGATGQEASSELTSSIEGAATGFTQLQDAISSLTSSVNNAVSEINSQIDSIGTNAQDTANKSQSAFSGFNLGGMINQVGIGIFSLQAMGNMATQTATALLGPASQAENTQASFSNLLGTTQAANKELDQLNNFAAKTQFKTQDIDNMAASMIAFKTPTANIVPELSAVGDALTAVGKGTPAEMQSVVDILGKIGIQGKLTQGDITQLGAHGINALDLIAEGSGKTTQQIQQMIAKGTLPAKDAIADLTSGIEKNPVYSGGMAKQSNTLSGLLSTLSSDWDQVMASAGKAALPALENGLNQLTTTLTSPSFKQFATTVGKDIVGGVSDLVTGIGNLVKAGEDTVNFFQQNQLAADALLAILGGLGAGVLVFAAVQIPALVVGFGAWAVGAGAAAIATLAAAAPFIIVGAIVALAIFGIVEAVQHWGQIMGWIHAIGDDVAHGFQSAWGGMGAFFSGVGAAMWGGIKWGINQAIGGLDNFINWLDSIHIDIPHIDAGPIQIAGGSIGLPHIPTIPLLASGGFLGAGTWGIVGEQGPELAYGGSSGLSVFSNSQSASLMSGSGGGGDIHIHNHNYIDGVELTENIGNRMMRNTRLQSGRRA